MSLPRSICNAATKSFARPRFACNDYLIWLVFVTLEVALNLLLTSHLGDSGMKNRPKSNTAVGIRPEIANTYLVPKSLN